MKYTIGLDFGTLSVRAVLVSVLDGKIVDASVSTYHHGVIDRYLPNGTILPNDYALQDPRDYIVSLKEALKDLISKTSIDVSNIIGLGLDFTASTILPIKQDGTTLIEISQLEERPHAYAKLWKHHSAEPYAKKITELAIKRNEPWIKRYGDKISSEWMLPKVFEILKEDPYIFEHTDYFIEAGDYLTYYLTGVMKRSSCGAGYKNIWHHLEGYPTHDYLKALHPKLETIYDTKLSGEILPLGKTQGMLKNALANELGLPVIPVAVSVIDAHVAAPACNAVHQGDMLMISGTSSCDIVLSDVEKHIPGIQGVVKDGAIPKLFAYESGQPAVGDMFSWYIEKQLPYEYVLQAESLKQNIYQFMEDRIRLIPPETPKLLALDWWNGNRSVLVDPDLTGVILGYTLQTSPEEIYKALIEASAFGKRVTYDAYIHGGVKIKRIIACGGLATKNKFLLECYANVLGQPIYYTEEEYAPALGAAIFGAVAARSVRGGYDSIEEASKKMSHLKEEPIKPTNQKDYETLYTLYKEMHDYFGKKSMVLKQLKNYVN